MNSQGDAVPPTPERRKGPSCWVIGGLASIAALVFVIVIVGLLSVSYVRTPRGHVMYRELATAWRDGTTMIPQCSDQMAEIRSALLRYYQKNQSYPASLADLSPDYVTSRSILHNPLDPNRDPNNISFEYTKPAPAAAPTTVILSFKWLYVLTDGSVKTPMEFTLAETLGGNMIQTQYVNGKQSAQSIYSNTNPDN